MQCQCSTIQLTDPVKAFIEKEYSDCLCLQCLKEITENQDREKTLIR
jgi:Cysteine-rich CWC